MNDPTQERRCQLAAWWVDFWLWIFALTLAYQLFTIGWHVPHGWWVPFLLWAIRRRVRKGESLGASLALSFVFLFVTVVLLWGLVDGQMRLTVRERRWYLSFAVSQLVLSGIATWFIWKAYQHVPRPARPERTEAQIARHAHLAGIVLLVGVIAATAIFAVGISLWQEYGYWSNPLKCYVCAWVLGWLTWLVAGLVRRGIGVPAVTALLLPGLICGVTGGVVMLIIFPVPGQRWFLALAYLVACSVALVISMRAILGGERKGQGDAG